MRLWLKLADKSGSTSLQRERWEVIHWMEHLISRRRILLLDVEAASRLLEITDAADTAKSPEDWVETFATEMEALVREVVSVRASVAQLQVLNQQREKQLMNAHEQALQELKSALNETRAQYQTLVRNEQGVRENLREAARMLTDCLREREQCRQKVEDQNRVIMRQQENINQLSR